MEKTVETEPQIAAIILAAGMSTRMGTQKLLLPWGKETVIEHILGVIQKAGLGPIVVVTGKVDPNLISILNQWSITQVVNTEYANGSMVTSMQKGLAAFQDKDIHAFMIFLGDQPLLQINTILTLMDAYKGSGAEIVVPSYQFHQGHPWLVDRIYWKEIQMLASESTLKEFLVQHKKSIQYVHVDSPTILQDMDTPEDFQHIKPA